MAKRPMPLISYDGRTYKLRSHATSVPDFTKMDRMDALMWMCKNTTPRGYSKHNPLAGMCNVLKVTAG